VPSLSSSVTLSGWPPASNFSTTSTPTDYRPTLHHPTIHHTIHHPAIANTKHQICPCPLSQSQTSSPHPSPSNFPSTTAPKPPSAARLPHPHLPPATCVLPPPIFPQSTPLQKLPISKKCPWLSFSLLAPRPPYLCRRHEAHLQGPCPAALCALSR
jgi:hypothetical protein